MTVYQGVKSSYYLKKDSMTHLDLFTYIVPFIAFFVDAAVKRAFYLQAKRVFIALKLVLIVYYLAIYVLALQDLSGARLYSLIMIVN